jgi:hypothetical protein
MYIIPQIELLIQNRRPETSFQDWLVIIFRVQTFLEVKKTLKLNKLGISKHHMEPDILQTSKLDFMVIIQIKTLKFMLTRQSR